MKITDFGVSGELEDDIEQKNKVTFAREAQSGVRRLATVDGSWLVGARVEWGEFRTILEVEREQPNVDYIYIYILIWILRECRDCYSPGSIAVKNQTLIDVCVFRLLLWFSAG